jgi:3-hydroxybutyryl-CoA dehydrogenase
LSRSTWAVKSDGFILNRIWAAIKRECLMVVAEGVAPPEDVDHMWKLFGSAGVPPFRLMDRVGLDVVLDIEEHYAAVRPGIPEGPAGPASPVHPAGPPDGVHLLTLLEC